MKYPALPKKEKDGPITVQDMADFYAEYIEHDALGKAVRHILTKYISR